MTFLTEFNFVRSNSYKDNLSPIQLALNQTPDFNKALFSLFPILLDDHRSLYLNCLTDLKPDTSPIGKSNPFNDPSYVSSMEPFMKNSFLLQNACGGNYVSRLDSVGVMCLKLLLIKYDNK